ncbi:MAG TPA: TraC family protein [Candidatus Saccharimonadales bacterium]|nr:TraC family protein [Candidatus Saccharimonadales bacterium]
MFTLQKSNKKASSRRQIDIKGAKDGILMLPSEQYRVVLQVSAVNFELKSEAEQDALIDTYQSFLNSLPCPLQILIRIREMDMDRYLDEFNSRLENEKEPVYRAQIKNYSEFVSGLITTNKILARHFYVVIPFSGKEHDFEVIKEQLMLSSDIIAKGLARLGMQSRQLTSLEILDLFYSFYNPGQAKRQPLAKQTFELLNRAYM